MEPIPGEVAHEMRAHPGKRANRVQVIAVILFATLCVAIGETLLAAGMKEVHRGRHDGFRFVLAAISNWHVLLGTFLMMVYFSLYSLSLSWADISFVLPFTALSYLFVAVFARFFLHEPVTLTRWIGAFIIVLGVVIVGLGERN
jgi:drug/metabolite transporter (DMT)-like permease